jgi:hypothetical protein
LVLSFIFSASSFEAKPRINEREVYSGGYLTKKVIFGDKLIERELVIEFRGEYSLSHHMAGSPPF